MNIEEKHKILKLSNKVLNSCDMNTLHGGNSLTNIAGETIGAKSLPIFKKVFDLTSKTLVTMLGNNISVINNALLGNMAERPWSEVSAEITDIIKKDAVLIRNILSDPDIRRALEDMIDVYSNLLAEVIQISLPAMKEIVEDFWDTIDKMAKKSVVGAVNTGMNVAEAAIAEIPVVGGVIELMLAFARGFNYFVAAQAPLIRNSGKFIGKIKQTGEEAIAIKDKYQQKLNRTTQDFQKLIGGSSITKTRKNLYKRIRNNLNKA